MNNKFLRQYGEFVEFIKGVPSRNKTEAKSDEAKRLGRATENQLKFRKSPDIHEERIQVGSSEEVLENQFFHRSIVNHDILS